VPCIRVNTIKTTNNKKGSNKITTTNNKKRILKIITNNKTG
jgi:hypothetical protein